MENEELSDADWDAIHAAENTPDVPEVVLESTPVGACDDCGARFEYGTGTTHGNLDPCPDCGSQAWEKDAYIRPDGTEIDADTLEPTGDA